MDLNLGVFDPQVMRDLSTLLLGVLAFLKFSSRSNNPSKPSGEFDSRIVPAKAFFILQEERSLSFLRSREELAAWIPSFESAIWL